MKIVGAVALTLVLLSSIATAATRQTSTVGTATLSVGRVDHPTGSTALDAVDYGSLALRASWLSRADASTWKLGYEGRLTAVSDDTQLGSMRHAAGLEWSLDRGPGLAGGGAGIQVARRTNDPVYGAYDRTEIVFYATGRAHLRPDLMWRTVAGIDANRYAALPEESSIEPHLLSELRWSLPSRTTLGVRARIGVKVYDDPVAAGVWGTPDTPKASEWSLGATASQSLGERIGLRAAVDLDRTLDDVPRWVRDDLYDHPLLDRYASEDVRGEIVLKVLGPALVWYEVGGGASRRDYGSLLFAVDGTGGERRDDIVWASVSAERRFRLQGHRATLRVGAGWIDQASTLASFDWTGTNASASLSWSW